jgi:hypothetical protein
MKVRFGLDVDESNWPLLQGGHCSEVVCSGRLDCTHKIVFIFQSVHYFNIIDMNQDHFLNEREARQFLQNKRNISSAKNFWFSKMDRNNDGLISPNEFDADLNHNMFRN